jgi:hypothetical protein
MEPVYVTKDVKDAVVILDEAYEQVHRDSHYATVNRLAAKRLLLNAIRYIVRPDRSIYPKTRRSTKGHPIMLSR